MPLNNGQWKTRPFLIDLNIVELKHYPYIITLCKCNGSYNTLTKISDRICVANKTENVNLNVFNLITSKMNQKCKCKFDRKRCKSILTKTVPTNVNEKKVICNMKNLYILLAFLLITMTLLIATTIIFS